MLAASFVWEVGPSEEMSLVLVWKGEEPASSWYGLFEANLPQTNLLGWCRSLKSRPILSP